MPPRRPSRARSALCFPGTGGVHWGGTRGFCTGQRQELLSNPPSPGLPRAGKASCTAFRVGGAWWALAVTYPIPLLRGSAAPLWQGTGTPLHTPLPHDGSCSRQSSREGTAAGYGLSGDLGGRGGETWWCGPGRWQRRGAAVPSPPPRLGRLHRQMHFAQTCMAVAMATAARWRDAGGLRAQGCAATQRCTAAIAPHGLASPRLWLHPGSGFTPGLGSPQVWAHPIPSSDAGARPRPRRTGMRVLLCTRVCEHGRGRRCGCTCPPWGDRAAHPSLGAGLP